MSELAGKTIKVPERLISIYELEDNARQAREYLDKHPNTLTTIPRAKRYHHSPSKYADSRFSHKVSKNHPWHFNRLAQS